MTPARFFAAPTVAVLAVMLAAGCGDGGHTGAPTSTVLAIPATTTSSTVSNTVAAPPTTTIPAATVPSTTLVPSTTTTAPPTTTILPTTAAAPPTTPVPVAATVVEVVAPAALDPSAIVADVPFTIGMSVQGRPINVVRRGDPNGVRILVVGVIHGNEGAGVAVTDDLLTMAVPAGVELWIVREANPDGFAADDRQNANGVDLNRNFPTEWGPLGEPGYWQYAGAGPASEPETKAMVALGSAVRPHLVLWYHQDLFRISPSSGRSGRVRERYAGLTGLPLVEVSGGTYTGTAAQWTRTVVADQGVTITVELGPTLSADEALAHANAVLTVGAEWWSI